jgi:hypothetical protein
MWYLRNAYMCNVKRSRLNPTGTTGGLMNLNTIDFINHPLTKLWNETAMWGGNWTGCNSKPKRETTRVVRRVEGVESEGSNWEIF